MLDPLSPNYEPDKPSLETPEKPLQDPSEINDNQGYRFNFFGRALGKKKKKKDESKKKNTYNETNAVELQLSPEAQEKIKKLRLIRKQRNDNKG